MKDLSNSQPKTQISDPTKQLIFMVALEPCRLSKYEAGLKFTEQLTAVRQNMERRDDMFRYRILQECI